MLQIQRRILRIVVSNEIPDRLIFRKDMAFAFLVAGEKSVEPYDSRKLNPLCQFQGTKIEIIYFLRGIGKQYQPSGIERIHNIAVVPFNTEGTRYGTARHIHHHRKPCAGLYRKLLNGI